MGRKWFMAALLAAALIIMPACAGLQPGSGGVAPATAGAPSTAGQIAQTVAGQQGQAPSTATSGTSGVYMYFAAQGSADIQQRVLDLAQAQNWTAEQTVTGLSATNGAPESVTITQGAITANSGSSSSIPAGTGGGMGVGGAGTVSRP